MSLTDEDVDNALAALTRPVPKRVRWFWDVEGEPLIACARFWKRDHAEEYAAILSYRKREDGAYRAVRYTIT